MASGNICQLMARQAQSQSPCRDQSSGWRSQQVCHCHMPYCCSPACEHGPPLIMGESLLQEHFRWYSTKAGGDKERLLFAKASQLPKPPEVRLAATSRQHAL